MRLYMAVAIWLILVAAAEGSTRTQAASTLAIDAKQRIQFAPDACPPGVTGSCFGAYPNRAVIRGLGTTTWRIGLAIDRTDPTQQCSYWTLLDGTVMAPGKGAFNLTGNGRSCQPFAGRGTIPVTFSGGDGRFSTASGTGQLLFVEVNPSTADVQLTGNLTVPGYAFDLTPPAISARNKKVRAPRQARAIRVRYSVTAHDAVDGRVAATCLPRSGSRFRIGRTSVNCRATDSSANEASARFVVTVKRR